MSRRASAVGHRRALWSFGAVCLLAAACGSSIDEVEDTANVPTITTESVATGSIATEPTATESIATEEPTTTMQTPPADPGAVQASEALVVATTMNVGHPGQELLAVVDRLSDWVPMEVLPGEPAEGQAGGTAAVFLLPLRSIGEDLDGFYLLSLTTTGPEPVVIRQASWQVGESSAALTVESTAGVLEATWTYSLRPRMRSVFFSDEDGSLGVATTVLHAADYGPGPVAADREVGTGQGDDGPAGDGAADDGSAGRVIRSTFTTPLWLIDQTPLAEACERVLEALGKRVGADDLRWPQAAVDDRLLEDGATAVEELLPAGQQINLVVEASGTELVRGKRLQPFVRYPLTLVDEGQNPIAATLGCSVSPV